MELSGGEAASTPKGLLRQLPGLEPLLNRPRPAARLRDAALVQLCDVLEQVGPDAPTLCGGFDAHELAIHVWQLSHDPLAWPGIGVRRFAPLTARRAARVRARTSFEAIVHELRHGPRQPRAMSLERTALHPLGEYWVHTQDVARPNRVELPAPSDELEDGLWDRLAPAAKILRGRRTPRLTLVRPDGCTIVVGRGPITRTLTGKPSELLLWVHGRRDVADVR
ncbi:maleylpyruvate isomerase family mycothiol-dependent enzyme [Aestuariimicrobium ganziense]|uniref:maleylpyruvate isomerase family mycothiol-dependent enzyme n=1 Tax=Aestuariimicrobium ganziense TaxID=2773677 RepID=UPI0019423DD2|nr:maleylpyruvate isomerase family mycothiol-dependent enzyme [Aestuariimicrobium ganziense]